MEFAFTAEQQMIGETARSWFAQAATSARTRAAMAGDGMDAALWSGFCRELGLSGVALPEHRSGAGLGLVELAIIAEAAGAQVAAMPLLGHAVVARAIAAGGSDAQQAHWLPRLIGGETLAAAALDAEVAADDDALTGSARLVPHGGNAGLFLVSRTNHAWLVPAGAGVTAHTPVTMDQTRPLATITLNAAAAEPLADSAAALAAAQTTGWVVLAAEGLGVAQAALDRTVAYAKDRVQFGRAIGSFQAYKHRLADMMIAIEQARSAVYWAACAMDEGSDEAVLALHAAKSFAADTAFKCAADMIQLHGGIGFTWEHDAHLFFKRARSLQTMMGSGAWHREQVARMVLGDVA